MVMDIVNNGFKMQRKEDFMLTKNSYKTLKILKQQENFSLILEQQSSFKLKENTKT